MTFYDYKLLALVTAVISSIKATFVVRGYKLWNSRLTRPAHIDFIERLDVGLEYLVPALILINNLIQSA